MAVRDIVERDVQEINKVKQEKRNGFTFEFQGQPSSTFRRFAITRSHPTATYRSTYVHFTQRPTGIEISYSDDQKFQVVAEWDEQKASCRLMVDSATLEPWQVSQKALASFFFDG